jgi:hypothetical protein
MRIFYFIKIMFQFLPIALPLELGALLLGFTNLQEKGGGGYTLILLISDCAVSSVPISLPLLRTVTACSCW